MSKGLSRSFSWLLFAILIVSVVGVVFTPNSFAMPRVKNKLVVDKNADGGYSGKYVMMYNPSLNPNSSITTGTISDQMKNVSNKIERNNVNKETDKDERQLVEFEQRVSASEVKKAFREQQNIASQIEESISVKYSVGSTRIFRIYASLNSDQRVSVLFTLVAKGKHCNIWTIKGEEYSFSNQDAVAMANEYDSKIYADMKNSFGDYVDPEKTGLLNILVYDIYDNFGYDGEWGYTKGYFTYSDLLSREYGGNSAAMIHVDTYPTIYWQGATYIQDAYSTIVHELQHLINFSYFLMNPYSPTDDSSLMDTWLNECCSMAAQEMVYPNSVASSRLKDFETFANQNYYIIGKSLYDWSGDIFDYAMNFVFGQYIRMQTGGYSAFKRMLNVFATDPTPTEAEAVEAAVAGSALQNMGMAEIVASFRLAMLANEISSYNGIYGFKGSSVFDVLPAMTYSYSMSTGVYGGGAIIIETNDGTFVPPANASQNLKYVGIDFVEGGVATTPTAAPTANATPTPTPTPTPTAKPTAVPWNQGVIKISVNNEKPAVGEIITVSLTMENCPVGMDTLELIIPIDTNAFEAVGERPTYEIEKASGASGDAAFRNNRSEAFVNWIDINHPFSGTKIMTFQLKVKSSGEIKLSDESFLWDADTMKIDEAFPMSSNTVYIKVVSGVLELTPESGYNIDKENGILIGVSENTTMETFLANFKNGKIIVKNANSEAINDKDAPIGTGYVVEIVDGNGLITDSATVMIIGDVNGDGSINSRDISQIQKYLFEMRVLEGVFLMASDVKLDGAINSRDIAQIQKKLVS